MLNSSKNGTPGDGELKSPIDEKRDDIPLLDHDEGRITVARKTARIDGLPTELIKRGNEKVTKFMYQFL